jgi:acetyl-CoA C-acetyltransferase
VIIAARRSAVGRAGGIFARVAAEDLAAPVLRAVLDDAGLDAAEVDDVLLGNAAGGGGNIARLSALRAGFPVEVPGVSVDRQCGAGLEAIVTACRLIAAGAGDVYLAGGVESVSRAPWRVEKPLSPNGVPRFYARARFAPEEVGDPEMGEAAENVARAHGISRARQDALALQSHRRAAAAQKAGAFDAEIVPVETGGGPPAVRDECPRADTSARALAALPPVFARDGTVTAGNSCPLNDGAAVVAVTSLARARRMGLSRALLFEDAAVAGVDPKLLGIGPVPATRRLLARRPDLRLEDVAVLEFNEAFAAQVLASLDALGIAPERINLGGGAIALGHPFGASGAILVTRIFSQLVRATPPQPGTLAMAMLGIGGGLGLAAAFRAWPPE